MHNYNSQAIFWQKQNFINSPFLSYRADGRTDKRTDGRQSKTYSCVAGENALKSFNNL
jgi:hypothetical protein